VIGIALAYDTDMSLLDNLITVRRVLEREMAQAAVARLTEAELAALAENIDRTTSAYDDYDQFRRLDNDFHAIVMKASGNEVGLTIVRTIHTHGGVMPPLASAASRAALKRTVAAHRAIYEALVARDGEAAGELIATHIETAWAERRRRKS
jgi:DNA-binding GntR family transcriptional regulator